MKTSVILGSRDPEGQTASATRGLVDGLKVPDDQVTWYYLPESNLESCRQCDRDGWGICATDGRCTIEDDLAQIVDAVLASQLVVFATPVYYGDLSESMRVLTDRLRRIYVKLKSRTGDTPLFRPAVAISVAGGGGGSAENCAASLKSVLSMCGFEVITSEPVRRQNLEIKTRMLRLMGEWLPDHIESGEWERVIPRPAQTK